MRTMVLAAAAALILGVGSAYADGGDGPQTNFYTLPNIAQTSVRNAPSAATPQGGQANHVHVNSQHRASPFLLNESGGGR